jgi:serine/threonine protein kinase
MPLEENPLRLPPEDFSEQNLLKELENFSGSALPSGTSLDLGNSSHADQVLSSLEATEGSLEQSPQGATSLDFIAQGKNTRLQAQPLELEILDRSSALKHFSADLRYLTLHSLGEGGMGVVERALDSVLGREVALKRIKTGKKNFEQLNSKQKVLLWRLKREAEIMAFLEHPQIVPLYDMQLKSNGELYFTMRKIEGEPLSDYLQKAHSKKPLHLEALFAIFFKISDAIAYAHSKKIIHRDLKPQNVMIGSFGEVYVMDWGIAKKEGRNKDQENQENQENQEGQEDQEIKNPSEVLQTLGGIGTPGYMAPEQSENAQTVSISADIYALGILLKEMLTGYSPLKELQQKLKGLPLKKEEEPAPLSLDLQAILAKATHNDPQKRYESVLAFRQDVERSLKHLQTSARSYSLSERFLKALYRHQKKIGITLLLTLLFIGFWTLFSLRESSKKAYEKQQEFKSLLQKAHAPPSSPPALESLLKSLENLNQALTLLPEDPIANQLKWETCQTLIQIACQSQEYQLAEYVAQEAKRLPFRTSKEKEELVHEIQEYKTQQLRTHLACLEAWQKRLRQQELSRSEQEDFIFEISKMGEPEIRQRLIECLEKGTASFLQETPLSTREQHFYEIHVRALGRLSHPESGIPLAKALEQLSKNLAGIPIKKRESRGLSYTIAVAEALAHTGQTRFIPEFRKARKRLGLQKCFV